MQTSQNLETRGKDLKVLGGTGGLKERWRRILLVSKFLGGGEGRGVLALTVLSVADPI